MNRPRFFRRRRRPAPPGPAQSLAQLDHLADSAVALAQQIKKTVAELRQQDQRGTTHDATG